MSFSSRESSPSGWKSSIENAQQSPRSSGGSIPPPRGGERVQAAPAGGGGLIICLVCGEGFPSIKSMFGHMKNHKNRGWKGAYPPPTFDYLTEFAEYQHLLVKPTDQQEEEEEVAAGGTTVQAEAPAPAPAEGRGRRSFAVVPDLNRSPEEAEAGEYLLPDLNFSPSRFL